MKITDGHRELHECITEHGPVSIKELAWRTGQAASTVSGRLRAMERYGYVETGVRYPECQYILGPAKLPGPPPPEKIDSPKAGDVAAMRERVHERALDAGIDVQVVAQAGFRLSVPHPFEVGRVWLDTPGDLHAWLVDTALGRDRKEEWRAAA